MLKSKGAVNEDKESDGDGVSSDDKQGFKFSVTFLSGSCKGWLSTGSPRIGRDSDRGKESSDWDSNTSFWGSKSSITSCDSDFESGIILSDLECTSILALFSDLGSDRASEFDIPSTDSNSSTISWDSELGTSSWDSDIDTTSWDLERSWDWGR